MADADLNIVLKLIDEASAGIKNTMKGVSTETQKVEESSKKLGETSKKTTNAIRQGFKEAHKGVREFHQILGTITFAMAAVAVTTKVWAEQNSETKHALDQIGIAMKNITGLIGSLFAPVIISLGSIMGNVFSFMKDLVFGLQEEFMFLFTTISFGIQRLVAFTAAMKTGVGVMEAWKISGEVAARAVSEMASEMRKGFEQNLPTMDEAKIKLKEMADLIETQKTRFLAGEISAEEYYNLLMEKGNQALLVNQMLAQQIQVQAALMASATPEVMGMQVQNETMSQAIQLQKDLTLARDVGQQSFRNQIAEQNALINFAMETHRTATQGMAAFTVALGKSIQSNLSTALTGFITGAKTAKEAFVDFGKAMIQTIVEFMAQKLVAWILEKTLLAGTVLATTTAASAIAAAWAPAAFLATVATLGAAAAQAPGTLAAAGVASLAVVGGLSKASKMINVSVENAEGVMPPAFHSGGFIRAHSGLAVDEVPIIAQTGEGILSRRGMSAIGGSGNLNRLNQGQGAGGDGDVYVTINYPKMTNRDEIGELARMLGIEVNRQMRYARGN